ncbi:hypothetical protein OAS19_01575 [Altererythrobacter sp.]|nr:hypothetical protein [Altererythrobacter sp.]
MTEPKYEKGDSRRVTLNTSDLEFEPRRTGPQEDTVRAQAERAEREDGDDTELGNERVTSAEPAYAGTDNKPA